MKLRKVLSGLLVLCLLLSCLPLGAGAVSVVASGQCGDNVTWKLDDQGVLTLSGTGKTWGYSTMINDSELMDRKFALNIYSLVVEEGITCLAENFCYYMVAVQSISLPSSLRELEKGALHDTSARAVTLPAGLKKIGKGAFPQLVKNVYFLGDAPEFQADSFLSLRNTIVSYPANNSTWTDDVMQQYCGEEILWVPDSAPLQVHKQICNTEAYFGTDFYLSVIAIGMDLRYFWQRRLNGTEEWEYFGPESYLYLSAQEEWEKYMFRCEITDGSGKVVYSEPVSLTVLYASKCENSLYEMYEISDLVLGDDGIYRTPQGATVYIAVNNVDDGGMVNWLSSYTLYDYVESFGSEYFDMSCWQKLTALMDRDGYVVLTPQSLQYLTTTITGNPKWGDDESAIPYYLFYDRMVQRLAGDNRWDTALQVADEMRERLGKTQFDAVIIASGNDFADALAGSYLSTVKNAPILLSWGKGGKFEYLDTDNIDYIKANLKPGGTVYILGGKNAVPELYEQQLKGYTIKRLGGANRFDTNLMILKEAGVKAGDEVLVCTSTNFADSLSASATGKPILLVFNESGKLYGGQPDYLKSLKNCSFTVIGGENAVSKKLADALNGYGKVERLAGANRFETSVMVAERYFKNPESAVLAYAWNYPDGLCGGALAYAMDAPLILTMTQYESQAAKYIQTQGIDRGVVLGGTGLIANSGLKKIFPEMFANPEDSDH